MNYNVPALSLNNISSYVSSVIAIPDLSQEEEIALFNKYREDESIEAAQKIIIANLKLVVKMAYKFRKFRDVVDLIQEGNIGLLTALKKFDIEKGVRFVTYAALWVKAKIQEFIISHMSIVRFGRSRDERMLFYNLASTIREIESLDKNQDLTDEELIIEVASRLGVEPEKVRENLSLLKMGSDVSIDAGYGDNDSGMQIEDKKMDIEESVMASERSELIEDAMAQLDEREQFIIKNRYMAEETLKLEEIGTIYGISKERVRQIEERALKKMRTHSEKFLGYA